MTRRDALTSLAVSPLMITNIADEVVKAEALLEAGDA